VSFAGIEKAIVTVNGKAQERPVSVGRRVDGYVEILSGVNLDEQVVLNPGNLQSGQPVTLDKSEGGPKVSTDKSGKPGGKNPNKKS